VFAVVTKQISTGKTDVQTVVQNPFSQLERHKGVKVAEMLAENGVDEVRTRVDLDGKGAGYALEARGVDTVTTGAATLKELLSAISQDDETVPGRS
jgi:predicted Fe-Mo cluster-binding NifX family protein